MATHVVRSLPQGTVLGPLLFLLMMNDIDRGTNVLLMIINILFRSIKNKEDNCALQNDLNSIYKWVENNIMKSNGTKFKHIKFSRPQPRK